MRYRCPICEEFESDDVGPVKGHITSSGGDHAGRSSTQFTEQEFRIDDSTDSELDSDGTANEVDSDDSENAGRRRDERTSQRSGGEADVDGDSTDSELDSDSTDSERTDADGSESSEPASNESMDGEATEQWNSSNESSDELNEPANDASSEPSHQSNRDDALGIPIPVDSTTLILGVATIAMLAILWSFARSSSDDASEEPVDTEANDDADGTTTETAQGGPIHG